MEDALGLAECPKLLVVATRGWPKELAPHPIDHHPGRQGMADPTMARGVPCGRYPHEKGCGSPGEAPAKTGVPTALAPTSHEGTSRAVLHLVAASTMCSVLGHIGACRRPFRRALFSGFG